MTAASTAQSYPGWNVRDSISAMNASALARAYGAFSFRNQAGTGTGQGGEVIVTFIPSYVGRICDSTGLDRGRLGSERGAGRSRSELDAGDVLQRRNLRVSQGSF